MPAAKSPDLAEFPRLAPTNMGLCKKALSKRKVAFLQRVCAQTHGIARRMVGSETRAPTSMNRTPALLSRQSDACCCCPGPCLKNLAAQGTRLCVPHEEIPKRGSKESGKRLLYPSAEPRPRRNSEAFCRVTGARSSHWQTPQLSSRSSAPRLHADLAQLRCKRAPGTLARHWQVKRHPPSQAKLPCTRCTILEIFGWQAVSKLLPGRSRKVDFSSTAACAPLEKGTEGGTLKGAILQTSHSASLACSSPPISTEPPGTWVRSV